IQESTKEILKNVIKLNKHLGAYQDYLKKLGGHLGTTVNIYNLANKEFSKIDKDVARISGEETSFEPELLDKPSVE
ncbi:MAG TPA: DNA recombination protein RmuC, partial [Patescibacteria group bacterium]